MERELHSQPNICFTIKYIQNRIAEMSSKFGYTNNDIFSYNRNSKLVTVRQLIWMELHNNGFTYAIIGEATHRRHSSVVIGVQRIIGLLQTDDRMAKEMYAIIMSNAER